MVIGILLKKAERNEQAMGIKRTERQYRRNVDSKLSEIRITVRSMNEYQTLVLDRENRLRYDDLKTKLKNLLETIHILDEDAWKNSRPLRTRQSNYIINLVEMENKQSMIEEWAKKVEHSKKQELSEGEAKDFMMIYLNAKKIDEDQSLIADLENKHYEVGSAFWLRVKRIHTYSVTPSLALFLSLHILNNFGKSTMMTSYLQYIAWKRGIKTIGIKEWSEWAFPFGVPTEDEWERLWTEQKLPLDMREYDIIDNMLDYPSLFGKSIWEIKREKTDGI